MQMQIIDVVGTTTTGQLAVTGVSTFDGNIDDNANLNVAGNTTLGDILVIL